MDKLGEVIREWMTSLLRGMSLSNVEDMFSSINEKVGGIAAELGRSPQEWNASIFNMIKTISDNVILPIAGMILTAILCYEFITMITEKNNMHDVPLESFAKIFLKMGVSIYVLSHTFDFVMAIFDVTQHIVNRAGGLISNNGSLELSQELALTINTMTDIPQLISITLLSTMLKFVMSGVSLAVMIILYGRMMQIFMYTSVAPIPFATFGNKEWGTMGVNYVRALAALGLQSFLMLICVAIYTALVQSLNTSPDIQAALLEMAGYTILLVITLFKTSTIAQSILSAH